MPRISSTDKAGVTALTAELGRLDELGVVMRAARQQLEDVFGADDCKQVRLGVAIERGEENMSSGFDELCEQAATMLAGSGTCSSISRQVTASNSPGCASAMASAAIS